MILVFRNPSAYRLMLHESVNWIKDLGTDLASHFIFRHYFRPWSCYHGWLIYWHFSFITLSSIEKLQQLLFWWSQERIHLLISIFLPSGHIFTILKISALLLRSFFVRIYFLMRVRNGRRHDGALICVVKTLEDLMIPRLIHLSCVNASYHYILCPDCDLLVHSWWLSSALALLLLTLALGLLVTIASKSSD